MMQDNENKRINAGYEIIACLPIGNVEFVVGQNIHNPNMFVTWEYKKEGGYYWGPAGTADRYRFPFHP